MWPRKLVGDILSRSRCFLLAGSFFLRITHRHGDTARNAPNGFYLYLGISQNISTSTSSPILYTNRVTYTLCVLLKQSPRAYRHNSKLVLAYIWTFSVHFPQSSMLVFLKIKNLRRKRNVEKPSEFLLLIMLYLTRPLLAKLKLVRRSL
jgi:hypothetical protein